MVLLFTSTGILGCAPFSGCGSTEVDTGAVHSDEAPGETGSPLDSDTQAPQATEHCGDGVDDDGDGCDGRCVGEVALRASPATVAAEATEYRDWGEALTGGLDVTGDGRPDLIVGAPRANHGDSYTGVVAVFDSPGYADFDETHAVSLFWGEAWERLGASVASADLDGDGVADLVVSGPSDNRVYPLYGPLTDGGHAIADITDGWTDIASDSDDRLTLALGRGLLTADEGFALAGASGLGVTGRAWVIPGDAPAGPVSDVAGAVLIGRSEDSAGRSVAVGDTDGDGLDDAVVTGAMPGQWGPTYVVRGPISGSVALQSADAVWSDTQTAVAVIDDLDGDGHPELAFGLPSWSDGTGPAGAVVVADASLTGDFVAEADALGVLTGSLPGEALGTSVAEAGDVDGDGTPDLLAGAPAGHGEGTDAGHAFLVLGPVEGHQPIRDHAITLVGPRNHGAGVAVAGLGDLDGDGLDDFAVGADTYETAWLLFGGLVTCPASQLWYADADADGHGDPADRDPLLATEAEGRAPDAEDCDDADPTIHPGAAEICDDAVDQDCDGLAECHLRDLALAEVQGVSGDGEAGATVIGLGDVNGDGGGDFALGVPRAWSQDEGYAGRVHVLYGPVSGRSTVDESSSVTIQGVEDYLGAFLAAADLTGDGELELVAASHWDAWIVPVPESGTRSVDEQAVAFIGEVRPDAIATMDLTRDGVDDLVVGDDSAASGTVLLFAGPLSGELTPADAHTTWTGGTWDLLGTGLASVGDLDGDGLGDLAAGGAYAFTGGIAPVEEGQGAVWILTEAPGGSLPVADATAVLYGDEPNQAADGPAAAGDVNGDGFDDLLVSGSTSGVFLVHGPPSTGFLADETTRILIDDHGVASAMIADLDLDGDGHTDALLSNSTAGLWLARGPLEGTVEATDFVPGPLEWRAGAALALADDVTGDGRPDLLVGAPYAPLEPGDRTGAVLVLDPAGLW